MSKRLSVLAAIALAGCTPDQFTRPTIPNVPPSRPAGMETRSRTPISPAQITEQNARQKLIDLENELEDDARVPAAKP